MKVKELIEHLSKLDQDAIVVRAIGSCHFSALLHIEDNLYIIGGMGRYSRSEGLSKHDQKAVSLSFHSVEL